jgi:hypothetical protein
MDTLWMVRVLFIAALAVGNLAHAMQPPFNAPTVIWHNQDFEGVHGVPTPWQVALGTWQADGQTYNSTTAARTALTTIFEYPLAQIAERVINHSKDVLQATYDLWEYFDEKRDALERLERYLRSMKATAVEH